jgi:hypothetical protein
VTANSVFRMHPSGLYFPFLSGGWLTSLRFDEYFAAPAWQAAQPWTWRAVSAVSWLALPLAWYGIWISARGAWACLRRLRDGRSAFGAELAGLPLTGHAMLLCLAVLVCQILLGTATGTAGQPHDLNSTWIVHALFTWFGWDEPVRRVPRFRWWVPVQAASLLVFLGGFAWRMQALRGTRWLHYGSTIADPIEVAQALQPRYAAHVRLEKLK